MWICIPHPTEKQKPQDLQAGERIAKRIFLQGQAGPISLQVFWLRQPQNMANDFSQRKDFPRVSVGERLWNDVEARSLFCVTNDATDNGGNAVLF